MKIGALEAGGTKMVCAIGDENGVIFEKMTIPTETPEITMPQILEYFKKHKIEALGIGCFGPINLNSKSLTFGTITTTPKIAWQNYNILNFFKENLGIPVGIDTDVNGSVLGEVTYGCAQGLENVLYITIGTGIGMGVWMNGQLHHGMQHPEAGHMILKKHIKDTYEGKCPYHKDCLEGLAAGPAIEARWGKKAVELASNEEVWDMEAYYIAQAVVNCIYTYSPEKIILGGGVMHQEQLFPAIRNYVKEINQNYVVTEELNDLDNYIARASLQDEQGILGALKLGLIASSN